MTSYLAYSIYSYFASVISWRIEKLYADQKEEEQKKIWFVLKNIFRVTGTALLIAHLLLWEWAKLHTGNKVSQRQSLVLLNLFKLLL